MARETLDSTGNEDFGRTISKIRDMFAELYEALTGDTAFTALTVGSGTKTAVATAGAATLNKPSGKITTEALTTAQDAVYTLTITNSEIAAADVVLVSLANGTNTQGTPLIGRVTPGAGSVVVTVHNKHSTAQALNGTLVISYVVFSA